MSTIQASGLTLGLKKSEFAKPEVKFIGHLIGSGHQRVDPVKIEVINALKEPETKKQLRQIIGIFSFFREYIPNFAFVAKLLTDLTSKRISDRIPFGQREAYASLWALQKYKYWIFGTRIILYSDHNPITFLTETTPKSSKLMRWSLALQEFDVEFRYRCGKFNEAADSLSRMVQSKDFDNQPVSE